MFVNEERAMETRVFTYFLNERKRKNNSYGWFFRNLRQNGAEFILSRGIITETRNGSFIAGSFDRYSVSWMELFLAKI